MSNLSCTTCGHTFSPMEKVSGVPCPQCADRKAKAEAAKREQTIRIRIGNAEIRGIGPNMRLVVPHKRRFQPPMLLSVIRLEAHPDGFPDMTAHNNELTFSKASYQEFLTGTGLEDLFGKTLCPNLPGCVGITYENMLTIASSKGFGYELPPDTYRSTDIEFRLGWFKWWMCWALENCAAPSIFIESI